MVKDSEVRNIWYFNINSESGTAIGKYGSKGSSISDLDIIAGFITASQQLSQEMVNSDETSKYNFEDIKGGAKRITLYTSWGNEISQKESIRDVIPVITSMLQVSGPKMEEYEYNDLLRFLRDINDEIVYRFMLGQLTKERVIDPLIHIDILDNVLKKYQFSKKGRLIGPQNNKCNRLVKQSLNNILRNDTKVIDNFLESIPLEKTLTQEDYEKNVDVLSKSIKKDIDEFLELNKKLEFIKNIKIYGKENSYFQLREKFNSFLDSQETYFEKRRVLHIALDEWSNVLENLQMQLLDSLNDDEAQRFLIIQNILPNPESLNSLIDKIKEDKQKKTGLITKLEKKIDLEINKFNNYLTKKNLNQLNQEIHYLKNIYETVISLIKELANYDVHKELDKFYNEYTAINKKQIRDKTPETTNSSDFEAETVKKKAPQDFRAEMKQLMNSLRKNSITKIINSLYEDLFNSYRKSKHILVYPGEIKKLIIDETLKQVQSALRKIQDFSFAAILAKAIKKIQPTSLVKHYSICLLDSFLQNYLYDIYVKNPFLIEGKRRIIALDSYSLKFCSELFKETELNKDIYKAVDKLNLSQKVKESFIQILDSTGLTRDNVALEIKDSKELFQSWNKQIDILIKDLRVKPLIMPVIDFLKYWERVMNTKGKDDDKTRKLNYFIRETIFRNTEPNSVEREELVESYTYKYELNKILIELKKLEKSPSNLFGKRDYNKMLKDIRTIIVNKLKEDKTKINELLKNITNIVDDEKTKVLSHLLNEIQDARGLLKNNKKLAAFEKGLRGIVKYEELQHFYDKLELLDNEFLKLEGYSHIKGIIKTVIGSEPLIKESNIQKKHKSRDLLMEALVKTYAEIYEDYFGKFTFQAIKELNKKKLGPIINSGKLFDKQYEKTTLQLKLQMGLNIFQKIFETIESNKSKFKLFNMSYLLNYLADYSNEVKISNPEEFIASFSESGAFSQFLDYLIEKFKNTKKIKFIKDELKTFYYAMIRFVNGRSNTKPKLKRELRILNHEVMDILCGIYDIIQPGERTFYKEGKHPHKDHPSKKYNLKKIPEKKFNLLSNEIDNFEQYIQSDINILKRANSFKPPTITTNKEIINHVSNNLKEGLKKQIDKYGLVESDFEDISRIRIIALLNSDEYDVPYDIKQKLILEGRYNKKSVKSLIEASTNISELLRFNINTAISKDHIFNEVLNTKIVDFNSAGQVIEYQLKVPMDITQQNRNIIFGKNAVWSKDKTTLIGFKFPFDASDKKIFGEAMRKSVHIDVFNELKPVIEFFNKYSREIHTDFDKVYNKLYE